MVEDSGELTCQLSTVPFNLNK